MMTIRKAIDRGRADHGWLDARHTFSFASYHDPNHMGFRSLRVLNEDRIQPGCGFAAHGHRDMEIISIVLDGALAHADDLGNGSVIRPGDVQRMSAGTGVTHSEKNASETEFVHLLQIWIRPATQGIAPSYEQRRFPAKERANRLRLVASNAGRDGSLTLHQDADLWLATLAQGAAVTHAMRAGRFAWVHVIRGEVELAGVRLKAGSAAALVGEPAAAIVARAHAEVLLFDLA